MLQNALGPSNAAFLILLTSLTLVLVYRRYKPLIVTLHTPQCASQPSVGSGLQWLCAVVEW